ncbi:MAG: ATP-grasp domain-containing protein [Dehalococcoidales bacterium]|nr:ATP-grasp domain-containing protein [Dehalococcoidales bacterium]
MRTRIAIVYNKPCPSRYDATGETKAVVDVLQSVDAVYQALLELGYYAVRVPLSPPVERVRRDLNSLDVDLVFNLFEGFCGYPETEVLVPETLEEMWIACTGCHGSVLKLTIDKAKVKAMMKAAGIPTPDFQVLNPRIMHMFQLKYPCIVKPRGEHASHGVSERSVVNNFTSLEKQVKAVSETYGGSALVEEFIDGREFSITVLGNSSESVLPVSEIIYSLPPGIPRILTFAAKWEADSPYFHGTGVVCPAEITAGERECFSGLAQAAFRFLGCRGYARIDLRVDEAGQIKVIEINPNPDISPGSGAVRQAAAAGMTYNQFIEKIVKLALEDGYYEKRGSPYVSKRQTGPDGDTAAHTRIQTA